MGVRNRLSGSLSIQNRWDQYIAAMRFWSPFIFGATTAVYIGGLYYIFAKKHETAEGMFYVQFKLDSAYKVSEYLNKLSETYPSSEPFFDFISDVATPRLFIEGWKQMGGTDRQLIELIDSINSNLHMLNLTTIGLFIFLIVLTAGAARWEAHRQTEDKYIKGSKLFTPRALTRVLRKQYGKGTMRIGKMISPKKMENLSYFVCGKPQMGKTCLFNSMLTEIQGRREQAIVFAAKREDFITTHYRPGIDLIFCPPEARTFGWSLKNDIVSVEDFSVLANVLAPQNPNAKEAMWDKGKYLAVKALLIHWWLATDRSNRELARVAKLSHPDMAKILNDTPGVEDAYGLIANPKSQTAYGFYVSVLCDLQPLQLLAKNDGDFSIRKWLATGKNCIFLPCSDRLEASLSPLYGMFLELMAINQMDMKQDRMRRVWWLVDELPAIAKVSKLSSLVNKGPSYGVCFVGGAQSIIQLDSRYGEADRRAILNSCATSIIYCIEDDKTAEELSKRIGNCEIEKAKENLSTASVESRDGVTVMAETKKEPLVSPDQLRDLPPLTFYVRVAGFGTANKMKIKYVPYKAINPDFIPNPEYSLEAFEAEYKQKMQEAKEAMQALKKLEVKEKEIVVEAENPQEQQEADEQLAQMMFDRDDGFCR